MIDEKPSCISCTVPMVKGYVGDVSQALLLPERWFDTTELKKNMLGAEFLKIDKKTQNIIVSAWRCPLCGRLDFFALE